MLYCHHASNPNFEGWCTQEAIAKGWFAGKPKQRLLCQACLKYYQFEEKVCEGYELLLGKSFEAESRCVASAHTATGQDAVMTRWPVIAPLGGAASSNDPPHSATGHGGAKGTVPAYPARESSSPAAGGPPAGGMGTSGTTWGLHKK